MKKNKSIEKKSYYSIGEVSEILQIRDYVIRFWEKEFSYLKPMISKKGNRRKYSIKDIQIIKYIHFLVHEKGYTLAGAKMQLNLEMENNSSFFQSSDFDFIDKNKKSLPLKTNESIQKNTLNDTTAIVTKNLNEIYLFILNELKSILNLLSKR